MLIGRFFRIPRRGQAGQPRGEAAALLAELLRRGRGRHHDLHGDVRHVLCCVLAVGRAAPGGRHQDGRVLLARESGPLHRLLHHRTSGGGGGGPRAGASPGAGNHLRKLTFGVKKVFRSLDVRNVIQICVGC